MIQLTQQMRDLIDPALAKGTPCLVATASKDGTPNIGYKGSVMVFDDESLAYWERTLQGTQHNLDENPNVMILFRDPAASDLGVGLPVACYDPVSRSGRPSGLAFCREGYRPQRRATTRAGYGSNRTGRVGSRPGAQGVCGDRQS